MFMKKFNIVLLFALLLSACGGGGDSGDVTVRKDQISIAQNLEILGDGEAKEMPIRATCNWTVSKNESWLTVTPMSGDKDTRSIQISAGKNTTGSTRTAILTISGGDAQTQRVMVTQGKSSDSSTPSEPSEPSSSDEPGADDNLPPS